MKGRFSHTVLILLAAMIVGFLFGRFVLGEGYLGPTINAIEPRNPLPAPLPITPQPQTDYPVVPSSPEEQTANPPVEQAPPTENPEEAALPDVAESRPATHYTVQIGSFADNAKATQLSQELIKQGYGARVEARGSGGDIVYRVLVGSYTDDASARQMADELKAKGQQAFVVQP